jgi:transposase-like protein
MTRRRRHSDEFKQNAVRMVLSQGKTASDVARELKIHPSQLFRWRQEMRDTAATMPKQESVDQEPARRPQDWTAEQKLEAVMASQKLPDAELGTFLRSRGLHKADLDEWRETMRGAKAELGGGAVAKSRESKRIRELERELNRKDKALAEASALLVLKKKAQAIWGAEDDDTEPTTER